MHAATTLGKDFVSKLKPATELKQVIELQNETDEASQIARLNRTIPLGGVTDIRPSLKRSAIGGVLSTHECLDVANTIYGGRQVKLFLINSSLKKKYQFLKDWWNE